jgi:dihydroorotate dehydrogenase
LARAVLFRMDPERAHSVGMFFARFLGQRSSDPSLAVRTTFGEIRNPIGLAAGFDKTGRYLSTLQRMGFGYIVAGTITLDAWPGHPKPRIVRNPKERTIVNGLGFPNPGAETFIQNVRKQREKLRIPIIASISGRTEDSIIQSYSKLQPHVSAIEVNLSSPNTENLKDLREPSMFVSLVETMSKNKSKSTYLKVPPFTTPEQTQKNIEMIKIWENLGFEGATLSNSILIAEPRLSIGTGGLSGPPLFEYSLRALKEIRKIVSPSFEINSVGGISNAREANLLLKEGATTVQIYTSLVYEGPGLIGHMLDALASEKSVKAGTNTEYQSSWETKTKMERKTSI